MITLYGFEAEIYQAVLLIYIVGYGLVFGVGNTIKRVYALMTLRSYHQNTTGKLLDGLWYGMIFILVGGLL